MNKKNLWIAGLISLVALVLNFQLALAHESVTIGDYEIEIGWVNEPPIVRQQNAIVVNVSNTSGGDAQPVEDVSSLTVTVSYGGQSKALILQPLGEDTPGQFVAPILPTIPGLYTITLGGTLGDTSVNVDVQPEEVQPADILQFPKVESSGQNSDSATKDWLLWLALLIGLVGVGLGVTALRKSR